jgi:Xaa-Pro aminopeptidase
VLTELNIPELKLIAYKENVNTEWILYSDPISEKEKLWGTTRYTADALEKKSGINSIRTQSEWKNDIENFSKKSDTISIRECDQKNIVRWFQKFKDKFRPLEPELLPLRMHKTEEEIEKMKRAIEITKIALDEVRNNMDFYQYERDIEADIARIYRKHGRTEAYPTIVASGPNACILHYTHYDRKLEDWDLIMIDTGAEYDGYAADISRTFVKGNISKRKNDIYTAVKSVQSEAIRAIRPGRSWDEHERVMRDIMNTTLKQLGLIPETCTKGEEEIFSRKYFPHRMSHFLWLDVHDSGERNDILQPGMVITCEPGIYIKEEGIGVRIEDDILITDSWVVHLSVQIPANITSEVTL